jgi:hypothetical protein
MTFDIVINNPDKPWNWWHLSNNPNITFDIVNSHPDKPWDWCGLSINPNITWDVVEANPDKPWNWLGLSMNPNITWDVVEANPDKPWDWEGISTQRHMFLSSMDICDIIKRHRAAKAIQRHWRHIVANPCYMVCKQRLLREFNEIAR